MVLEAKTAELPWENVEDLLPCEVVFPGPLRRLDCPKQSVTMYGIGIQMCVAGSPCVR